MPYITLFDLKMGFIRNVPYRQLVEALFTLKKFDIATKQGGIYSEFYIISISCLYPTPLPQNINQV